MNLSTFTKIVRPVRTLAIAECGDVSREDGPLLVFGGPEDIAQFAEIAPRLDFGSAAVLNLTQDPDILRAEDLAARHHFRKWYVGLIMPGFTSSTHSWIKSIGDMGYASHHAVLMEAALRTTGPMLELGAGHGSTPLLHAVSKVQARTLVTVEQDPNWARLFEDLATPLHRIEVGPILKSPRLDETFGLIFIDNSPGESRADVLKTVHGNASYIVVHDTDELGYGMEPVLKQFKYRRDFRRHRPWTTVVSDEREIWE